MDKRKNKAISVALLGIALNLILGAIKLFVGIFSKSTAVLGDAVNNLLDSVASIVTVTAFLLANRKADREHPFGHGRYEYVASLVIGILILFVGFQFVLTGIERIISPSEILIEIPLIIVLSVSVAVKGVMTVFYWTANRSVQSQTLKATAFDCLFDALITTAVLVAMLLYTVLPFKIDGYMTVAVAVVIVFGGVKVILEAMGSILGKGASEELVQGIYKIISECGQICGAHDLVVHDYGMDKRVGSVHVEFEEDLTISKAHKIVDALEKRIKREFSVELVIHVDHIDRSDPRLNSVRQQIVEVLSFTNATIHDLHIENNTICFDVVLPHESDSLKEQLYNHIKARLNEDFSTFNLEINFDFV